MEKHQPVPPNRLPSTAGSPGGHPGVSRAPSWCLSALSACCSSPAALPVTLPGTPPSRRGRRSLFAPLAASQGKQDGLGSLAPAAGEARTSLIHTHIQAGDEGGGVWKERQVGCVEASGALWGAEQAEISPSVPSLPSPAFLHCITPARATQRWGQDPKGPPCPCCTPGSPWGGQQSHRHILGCWCPSFVLVEQSEVWEAG